MAKKPKTLQQYADSMLAGWHAAKRGEPIDRTQGEAWLDGYAAFADVIGRKLHEVANGR